jgi:hypothetical protein
MPYTVQQAEAVATELKNRSEEYAKYLGELLATAANICGSADGLEIASGIHRDRDEFYAEALDSICEELSVVLKKILPPEQLNWYFFPASDSEEEE